MSTATQSYYGTLNIETCIKCGVSFGVPADFQRQRKSDQATFYCPNGHHQCYMYTEEWRLRNEVARLTARMDQKDAEIKYQREQRYSTERSLKATKGVVTKLKKRAKAGVCPCCNRTFKQLAAHMACKHPEFAPSDAGAAP